MAPLTGFVKGRNQEYFEKINSIVTVIQLFTTRGTSDGICEGKEPRKHDTIRKQKETAVETYKEQN